MSADLVVIGGGLSGILQALRAAETGRSVVLLERSGWLGGAIRGIRVDESVVDVGAESFSVVSDEFRGLLESWGLADDIVSPEPVSASIVRPEGRIRIPHGVMGVPTGAEALRDSGAFSPDEVNQVVQADQAPFDLADSITVAELVRARLGDAVYRRLVRPVVTGVWGEAADQLDAQLVMPELVHRARQVGSLMQASWQLRHDLPQPGLAVQSLRGGLHTLVSRATELLTDAGVRVEYNTSVTGLRPTESGWVVTAHRDWEATTVCLAVGPELTQSLLASAGMDVGQQDLPTAVTSRIVVASVESAVLDDYPWGSGALIADEVGADIKAFSHINAKWGWWQAVLPPGRHLVRMSMRQAEGSVDDSAQAARRALSEVIGVESGAIRDLVVHDWPDVLSRPHPGASDRLRGLAEQAEQAGLILAGSSIPGSGLLRLARRDLSSRQQKEEYVPVS